MTLIPIFDRPPTARERMYLDALERGETRPAVSGWASKMCRKFGWCEEVCRGPDGTQSPRSALPEAMDMRALFRAGYRAVGFTLTSRGRRVLAAHRETATTDQ